MGISFLNEQRSEMKISHWLKEPWLDNVTNHQGKFPGTFSSRNKVIEKDKNVVMVPQELKLLAIL